MQIFNILQNLKEELRLEDKVKYEVFKENKKKQKLQRLLSNLQTQSRLLVDTFLSINCILNYSSLMQNILTLSHVTPCNCLFNGSSRLESTGQGKHAFPMSLFIQVTLNAIWSESSPQEKLDELAQKL